MGVKKGNGPSKKGKAPSHLRGEATPLSQEEVEVSVDSDDDSDDASDNSGSEDAVDDERHLFQEKSNVVEFNSTIETHWNDALFGSRRRLFSFAGVKKLVRKWAGGKKIPA